MDMDDYIHIIGEVVMCKTMSAFEHPNTQKTVSAFTNGLKFQLRNETYSYNVDIITFITYNSSTEILDSLHSIQVALSIASLEWDSVIQVGLNIWFTYFKQ